MKRDASQQTRLVEMSKVITVRRLIELGHNVSFRTEAED
jgi:hypothetical protein